MKLLDLSVLTRLTEPTVATAVRPLLEAGEVATCGLVDLQLYAGMTHPTTLARVVAVRSAAFRWLSIDDADLRTALGSQRGLIGEGLDGGCWPSLIVAALAVRHHIPVLHYDSCFDRIAKLSGQPVEWVVPAGSLP